MASAGDGGDPFLQLQWGTDLKNFHRELVNGLRLVVVTAKVEPEITELEKTPVSQMGRKIHCCFGVGVGMSDDPLEYPGMAHLVEHLFAMRKKRGDPNPLKAFLYSPENLAYYPFSTANTYDDVTTYQCDVWYGPDAFNKLVRFFDTFNSSDFEDILIKTEARAIHQEYEWKLRGTETSRFAEVARFFHPSCKALRHFTNGNLASLRCPPPPPAPAPANVNDSPPIGSLWLAQANWDLTHLQKTLKEFVKKHYKLKNCVLVLQGDGPLPELLTFAKSIASIISKTAALLDTDDDQVAEQPQQQQPQQPPSPQPSSSKGKGKSPIKRPAKTPPSSPPAKKKNPAGGDLKTPPVAEPDDISPYVDKEAFYKKLYIVLPVEYSDKIHMNWIVDYGGDETKYSRVKPLQYISALLKCCKSNTLVHHLMNKDRQYITAMDVRISKSCFFDDFTQIPWSRRYKAQLFTIILSLTQAGIKNRDKVIAAVLCYIRKLEANESIYNALSKLRDNKLDLFGRLPRNGQTSVQHIACAVLYPEKYNKNLLTDKDRMYGFDKNEIERVLAILGSVDKLNVVVVAHLENLSLPEQSNGDNQPLGFGFQRREFTREESQLWGEGACQADEGLGSLRMPSDKEIEPLDGNAEWTGLLNPATPSQPHDWKKYYGDPSCRRDSRCLFVRAEDLGLGLPFTRIEVQLLSPNYLPFAFLRPYMSIFKAVLQIRSQFVNPTWAQAECCKFEVSLSHLGSVTVKIAGLHHFAIRSLLFVLSTIKDIESALDPVKDAVLQSERNGWLDMIYDHKILCQDLLLRGMLTSYTPFIESYRAVARAHTDPSLAFNITSCFEKMKITVYARSNVTWDFDSVKTQLSENMPLFVPKLPQTIQPHEYYKQLILALVPDVSTSPPILYMNSPNRGSHLSAVLLTYDFSGANNQDTFKYYAPFFTAWVETKLLSTLRASLGMAYSIFVRNNISWVSLSPILEITVMSDSRWYRCHEIRQWIMHTIDASVSSLEGLVVQKNIQKWDRFPGVDPKMAVDFAKDYLLSSSPNRRMYTVQVEGHQTLAMVNRENPHDLNSLLDYPELIPRPVNAGLMDHIRQRDYLDDPSNRKSNSVCDRDLESKIPP